MAALRREPYRMGFFGTLSIGFLAAAAVAVVGYLMYTAALTRTRTSQYGALRANGLSVIQLVAILVLEQGITLGVAIGVGVALARGATRLFLPFLRDHAADLSPVPPFLIVTNGLDSLRLIVLLAGVLVVAVITIVFYILRTRLAAAIKLGGLE